MMDDHVIFESGNTVSQKDFISLKQKVMSEVSCGFRITDLHIYCKKSDRMRVNLARELLSKQVSLIFQNFFSQDASKMELSKFIEVVDLCFNILTSNKIYDSKDPSKQAFEVDIGKY